MSCLPQHMLWPAEFQSHEPEFDYLKSLEIEEKINTVVWGQTSGGNRLLLSTNDKTIKLWKVGLQGHRRAAVSALIELAPLCVAAGAQQSQLSLCCNCIAVCSFLGLLALTARHICRPGCSSQWRVPWSSLSLLLTA